MFMTWPKWLRITFSCIICFYSSYALSKDAQVRILLSGPIQFQYAGYYVAKAKGFYQDAGLSVEIINQDLTQEELVQAITEGSAEFSVGNSSLALFALKGSPVVVLSNIFQRSSGVMIVKPNFGNQIFNFSNKKMVLPSPMEAPEIYAFLTSQGAVFPDTVKRTEGASSLAEFTANKVSAIFGQIYDEPLVLEAENIPFNVIDPVNYGVHFYGDTLFANRNWVDQNSSVAKSFIAATLKGWQYAFSHRAESALIIRTDFNSTVSPLELEREAQVIYELVMPEKTALGHVDPMRWHLIGDFFKRSNLILLSSKLPATFFIEDVTGSANKQYYLILELSLALLFVLLVISLYWFFPKFIHLKKSVQEQILLVEEAQSKANHDPLTNLPNRRLLIERLREAVHLYAKSEDSFALCFLDIDNFKNINDQYGHSMGDDILIQIAMRLQNHLEPTDTLARQGGDEFVILMYGIDSIVQILEKMRLLKRVIEEPLMINGEIFVISASFGYSLYKIDSNSIEDLLKVADRRMYREKFRSLERQKNNIEP